MKLRITVEDKSYEVDVEILDDNGKSPAPAPHVAAPSAPAAPRHAAPPRPSATPSAPSASTAGGGKACAAPLAGTVTKIDVKPGDAVEANAILIVMEAMKMETPIPSPAAGKVKAVNVSVGQAVKEGDILIEFE